ncbi:MAG: deoxyguanosinetriphosphate triphosphohydrolase [Clostridia bacterium]|nr:deoxyguanosinetriphosphate triphosphohydrolase [Clostridia bacterium]
MNFRERSEALEMEILSPYAAKASQSLGRETEEKYCDVRTCFQRDRDRIIHSKAFRRLKHKTQVFLSPEGDHYRTRLTHTLEVSQIARTIARALRLNEDLTEAIALGHDLGHTPFGHCGEDALDAVHEGGFHHNIQSERVVSLLETRGNGRSGLNLTKEVRDGILNHTGETNPITLEGRVVKLCDRIAYINHDIDDAIRAGVLTMDLFEQPVFDLIGRTHSMRINTLIMDVISTSLNQDDILMSDAVSQSFLELRQYMFEHVYLNPEAKKEETKARMIVKALYNYYVENPSALPMELYALYSEGHGNDAVKDYIAGMTDRYAVTRYKELFIPRFWT